MSADELAESLQPKSGETWYVKVLTSKVLEKMTVTDLTPLTVELDRKNSSFDNKTRYERSDIKFVEKLAN